MNTWRYVSPMMLFALVMGVGSAAAQDQSQFSLTGVVTKEDGSSVAWLEEPTITQSRPVLIRPGDQVGPYRVAKIEEDRVELDGPSGKLVVRLYGTAPMGAPASTAPSAPALAAQVPLKLGNVPIPQIEPKDARAYLDAHTDPRIRTSKGFHKMLGN